MLLSQTERDVATVEQSGQLLIAASQVQHDRERVVLLCTRDEEIQEEALAASCRAQHECVADVLDVQVVRERRVVRRLEGSQWLRQQQ